MQYLQIFKKIGLCGVFFCCAFFCTTNLFAQDKQLRGVVYDAIDNSVLAGVSVKVKGTKNVTATDGSGTFLISAKDGDMLEFFYIGYLLQEVEVKGQTTLQVSLSRDLQRVEEVVVVGYGAMKRSDVATAITSVKPEQFNMGGGRDVKSLLEGKVAGLTVTRTGGSSPNSNVAIQLRGVVSVNGSQSPLVVIDGIPGGNIDLLRAEDVESFEVLKDGAAASIYGSSANAGVILITTKKGKAGPAQFDYSTFVNKYYESNKPKFLSADQYRTAMADLGYNSAAYDRGGNTDMYAAIVNKENISHSHNLAVSGGSENTSYRGSVYYSNLEGVALANSRQQYGGRMSLQAKGYQDMLTFQSNLATNYNNMDMLGNEGWTAAARANPTNPMYNEDGTFYEDMASDENKFARLSQQKYDRIQQTTSADAKLIFEPIKNLRFSAFGSVQRDDQKDNKYYDKASRTSVNSYDGEGYAYKWSYFKSNYAFEPTIDYSVNVNNKHQFTALGGYSYRYQVEEAFNASNSGFLNDANEENDLGAGSYLVEGLAGMGSEKVDETLIAFFGRLNYVFDDKYIVQASLRREGSSKFGRNYKWGNFPSVSLAWNISNEAFLKDQNLLSNLKLRIGYGETGNSGMDPYQSVSTIGTGGYYLSDDGTWIQTYGPNKNPNPNLRWETKKEWNFGLDFGFLSNRISGSFDFYNRITDDLLLGSVTVPIPSNVISTSTMNIGRISSKGLELSLNTTPYRKGDFIWKVDMVSSYTLSNTMDKFASNSAAYLEFGSIGGFGALGNAVRIYEGSAIGNFFGKRFAGFDENGEWLFYNAAGEKVAGSSTSDSDKTIIGNGVPRFYLSLTNTLQYKKFDFSFLLRGKFGFDILNRQKMAYGNMKTLTSGYNVLQEALETGLNASYQYSDYFIEKGDYMKLDNVTLGYSFKPKNVKIPRGRVYFTVRDLATFTKYSGETPEVDDTGLYPGMAEYYSTPVTRNFMLGLQVQF
ncbi:SusC/RagA family TonB-linked outer membrane protein [Sphingobacterium sp. LRF_L2]|uniref:SusC/RagA family TonB-linked outer membrane protein n=1 Tax=Sphingobacterium sp. LRF_L2 TaxID=3369421 RepID=UPI003F5E13C5